MHWRGNRLTSNFCRIQDRANSLDSRRNRPCLSRRPCISQVHRHRRSCHSCRFIIRHCLRQTFLPPIRHFSKCHTFSTRNSTTTTLTICSRTDLTLAPCTLSNSSISIKSTWPISSWPHRQGSACSNCNTTTPADGGTLVLKKVLIIVSRSHTSLSLSLRFTHFLN